MDCTNETGYMTFATKERARALASPTNADMIALRHLVRYYRTTSDLELKILPKTRTRVPEGEPELLSVQVYSDSDWPGCHDTRRSTSGGIIYFEGAVLIILVTDPNDNSSIIL